MQTLSIIFLCFKKTQKLCKQYMTKNKKLCKGGGTNDEYVPGRIYWDFVDEFKINGNILTFSIINKTYYPTQDKFKINNSLNDKEKLRIKLRILLKKQIFSSNNKKEKISELFKKLEQDISSLSNTEKYKLKKEIDDLYSIYHSHFEPYEKRLNYKIEVFVKGLVQKKYTYNLVINDEKTITNLNFERLIIELQKTMLFHKYQNKLETIEISDYGFCYLCRKIEKAAGTIKMGSPFKEFFDYAKSDRCKNIFEKNARIEEIEASKNIIGKNINNFKSQLLKKEKILRNELDEQKINQSVAYFRNMSQKKNIELAKKRDRARWLRMKFQSISDILKTKYKDYYSNPEKRKIFNDLQRQIDSPNLTNQLDRITNEIEKLLIEAMTQKKKTVQSGETYNIKIIPGYFDWINQDELNSSQTENNAKNKIKDWVSIKLREIFLDFNDDFVNNAEKFMDEIEIDTRFYVLYGLYNNLINESKLDSTEFYKKNLTIYKAITGNSNNKAKRNNFIEYMITSKDEENLLVKLCCIFTEKIYLEEFIVKFFILKFPQYNSKRNQILMHTNFTRIIDSDRDLMILLYNFIVRIFEVLYRKRLQSYFKDIEINFLVNFDTLPRKEQIFVPFQISKTKPEQIIKGQPVDLDLNSILMTYNLELIYTIFPASMGLSINNTRSYFYIPSQENNGSQSIKIFGAYPDLIFTPKNIINKGYIMIEGKKIFMCKKDGEKCTKIDNHTESLISKYHKKHLNPFNLHPIINKFKEAGELQGPEAEAAQERILIEAEENKYYFFEILDLNSDNPRISEKFHYYMLCEFDENMEKLKIQRIYKVKNDFLDFMNKDIEKEFGINPALKEYLYSI